MKKFGIRMAVVTVACSALSLGACGAEETNKKADAEGKPAAVEQPAPVVAAAETAPAAAPAADAKPAATPAPEAAPPAAAPATPEPAAKEAAPAPAAAAPTTPAATPAEAPAAAPSAAEAADNKAVQDMAATAGATFADGRYKDKDGHPAPVVTKDYKVDWATWQGFRRYHDACHVCHGPNALGSTFAPSLADSLKTMDYETFFGIVVGGRVADRGGTKYVMPAFGEDKNIMCYLDDIYTYIKARSTDAMPPGRPAGRQDISPEAKKAAADCTG